MAELASSIVRVWRMTVKWPAVGEVATGLHTGDSYEEYSIRKKGYKHTITNN